MIKCIDEFCELVVKPSHIVRQRNAFRTQKLEEAAYSLFVGSGSLRCDSLKLQVLFCSRHHHSKRREAASAKFHFLKVHKNITTDLLARLRAIIRRRGRLSRLLPDLPFVMRSR